VGQPFVAAAAFSGGAVFCGILSSYPVISLFNPVKPETQADN